ncbi:MAG: hypothetical protein O7D95_06185 [Betaproteobacteria bacterium]|nr:hypothetical protein [Betaproteobacteria bacterium]
MAIDSREKRQSVPGVGRPYMRSHQTATIDEQWRLGVGNVYNGNALSPPAAGIVSSLMLMGVGMSIYGISLIVGILYG